MSKKKKKKEEKKNRKRTERKKKERKKDNGLRCGYVGVGFRVIHLGFGLAVSLKSSIQWFLVC